MRRCSPFGERVDKTALDFRSFFEDTAALVPERPYLIWTEGDSGNAFGQKPSS